MKSCLDLETIQFRSALFVIAAESHAEVDIHSLKTRLATESSFLCDFFFCFKSNLSKERRNVKIMGREKN